jgi:hypothetical protein
VLAVLVVGAFAKLPEAVLPIGSDTGMYATYARMILHGGRPYVDFYDVHPPLAYWYWVLVELVAGTDWSRTCIGAWGSALGPQPCVGLLAHGFDLGLTFITAGLVHAIARQVQLRPFVGVLAALLVVWFANESMISQEGSTPTKLTLVPSTLAIFAYLRALSSRTTRRQLGWAALAGAGSIAAVMAKQPGVLTLLALVAYTLAVRMTSRRLLLGIGLGALIVLAPALAYLGAIGSLGGFIDQPWVYNTQRVVIGYWQSPAGLTSPATRIDRVATEAAGLLFVGALLGGLAVLVSPSTRHQRLLLVWGIFSMVAIAGFREWSQVVPAFALLAAVGIGRLWEAAGRDGLGLGRPLAGRLGLVAVFGAIFVLSSGFQLLELRRAVYERGPNGKPADPEQIAMYLRQDALPGPILTWAQVGQVYALSGRDPATRYVIAEFTDAIGPRATASRSQLMKDVQAQPPAEIVVDPHGFDDVGLSLRDFTALDRLIQTCYQKVSGMPANWGVYVTQDVGCVRRVAAE